VRDRGKSQPERLPTPLKRGFSCHLRGRDGDELHGTRLNCGIEVGCRVPLAKGIQRRILRGIGRFFRGVISRRSKRQERKKRKGGEMGGPKEKSSTTARLGYPEERNEDKRKGKKMGVERGANLRTNPKTRCASYTRAPEKKKTEGGDKRGEGGDRYAQTVGAGGPGVTEEK